MSEEEEKDKHYDIKRMAEEIKSLQAKVDELREPENYDEEKESEDYLYRNNRKVIKFCIWVFVFYIIVMTSLVLDASLGALVTASVFAAALIWRI